MIQGLVLSVSGFPQPRRRLVAGHVAPAVVCEMVAAGPTEPLAAMAEGARRVCDVEIAVAITGIAGPSGGSQRLDPAL